MSRSAVVARLRAALARALAGGPDPAEDPAVAADLELLGRDPLPEHRDKIAAFAATMVDQSSFPGLSRAVVLARGQRFLLALAMELEDVATSGGEKASREPRSSPERDTAPACPTPFDPALLSLDGVGPRTAAKLASRGLTSPAELLFWLPRRYDDRRRTTPVSSLTAGARVLTEGTVRGVRLFGPPWRRNLEVEIEDGGATAFGVWFTSRRPRPERFQIGGRVQLAGLVSRYRDRLQIAHPVVVDEGGASDRIGRVVPVYPEVPGVPGRVVEKAIRSAADRASSHVTDPLPEDLLAARGLMPLHGALALAHMPPTDIAAEEAEAWLRGASPAHRRLAYDELFYLQLALALRRRRSDAAAAPSVSADAALAGDLGGLFGFAPTAAQRRVVAEIAADLGRPRPMQRLLQGDVGSGKTFVALAAIVASVRAGFQAALMAPTEILAEQHMRTLHEPLARLGIRAALHLGGARASTRQKNRAALEHGTCDLAVGTHALIQESVLFRRLGLAIVDEQHRFGVAQRLGLVGKGPDGAAPHLLVMTATPIPRTLALTIHGDLDVSTLDELPPGRCRVATSVWPEPRRDEAFHAAAAALGRGEQVYVVCPVIEESEKLDVRAAESVFEELRARFSPHAVGLLHGRLGDEEKEASMAAFVRGETRLLVTTTVIEVGVDVGNATVMVVESAERFGLAQLHQLRGRVGRSTLPSSCHLIADPSNRAALERLEVLCRTNDGFAVAEADLALRGPGDLYGRRQAGLPGLRFGDVVRDVDLLAAAREDALAIVDGDPDLVRPLGRALRDELARRILSGDGPVGEEAG